MIFSYGNLLAHLHCLGRTVVVFFRQHLAARRARKEASPGSERSLRTYGFLWVWVLYGLLHMLAWFTSSLFHIRDNLFTERVDYAAADLVMGMGLVAAIVRSLRLNFFLSLPVAAAVGYGWYQQVGVCSRLAGAG